MSGPKRNPDKLNTIGVVVVGICGAVLVYVTIVALQAFYMNDTSEIQTMADYGGQDKTARGRRADELRNISEAGKNAVAEGQQPTFRIPIEHAMKLVSEDAKKDPAHLIPALPRSEKASIEPVFGRPKPAAAPAPAGGAAPAPGATPPAGLSPEGAPGAAPAGAAAPAAGSAPAPSSPTTPTTPTGAPGAPQPTGGTGGVPTGATPPAGATPGPAPAKQGARAPANTQPAPGAQPQSPASGTQPAPGAQPAPARPKNP